MDLSFLKLRAPYGLPMTFARVCKKLRFKVTGTPGFTENLSVVINLVF